jgi:hypothetical protein
MIGPVTPPPIQALFSAGRTGEPSGPPARSKCAGVLVLTVGLYLALATNTAQSDEPSAPRIVGLQLGFDGYFKVGHWTPVEVTIEGDGQPVDAEVELTVLDGDAVPSRVRPLQVAPASIGPGETVSVRLFVKIGQLKSDVTVGLRSEGKLISSRKFGAGGGDASAGIMNVDEELIVTLGLPSSTDEKLPLDDRKTKVARLAELDQLPTRWWG